MKTKNFVEFCKVNLSITRTENEWKGESLTRFLKEETTEAKESLWRVCGNNIPNPIKRRQGASKSNSEINDISEGMKVLAENDHLPIFLATSDMIKETPMYLETDKLEFYSHINKYIKTLQSIDF